MQPALDAPQDSWRDDLVVELVPHVVHRLGNQLTVILGTADLLALTEADQERREQLDAVATSARQATELLRSFGLRARANPEPARAQDLTHTFAAVESLVDPLAKAGGFRIHAMESRGVALVRADGNTLELLLLGLLGALLRPRPEGVCQDGDLRLAAVELGHRVALLATVHLREGEPLAPVELDPRATQLLDELGFRVRQRVHPGGAALTLLLGMPALEF